MSPETAVVREKAEGKEQKAERMRRGGLRGMARKTGMAAKQLEEQAIREEEQTIADHQRVRELADLATGGAFSAILRKSPAFSDDDRAFLKELGYI